MGVHGRNVERQQRLHVGLLQLALMDGDHHAGAV
jgi:hypothetical protein